MGRRRTSYWSATLLHDTTAKSTMATWSREPTWSKPILENEKLNANSLDLNSLELDGSRLPHRSIYCWRSRTDDYNLKKRRAISSHGPSKPRTRPEKAGLGRLFPKCSTGSKQRSRREACMRHPVQQRRLWLLCRSPHSRRQCPARGLSSRPLRTRLRIARYCAVLRVSDPHSTSAES